MFSDQFFPKQAYTVLCRAKQLDQLYLLDVLYEDKIYATRKPLIALKELEKRAINNNHIGKRDDLVNMIVLNVQNLMHHIEDIKKHHILHDQNLLVFSETWIPASQRKEVDHRFSLDNFVPKFCNVGNGNVECGTLLEKLWEENLGIDRGNSGSGHRKFRFASVPGNFRALIFTFGSGQNFDSGRALYSTT